MTIAQALNDSAHYYVTLEFINNQINNASVLFALAGVAYGIRWLFKEFKG